MTILVINSGSSSIKAALFEEPGFKRLIDIRLEKIGEDSPELRIGNQLNPVQCQNHNQALKIIFNNLINTGQDISKITAVGHRVVHGGEKLIEPTLITDEIEQVIESMNHLAPLHNPACLEGIRAARKALENSLNKCPHIAVFDTGFHSTLPSRAKLYALPSELTKKYNLRRFGFHGINHQYVSAVAARYLHANLNELRIISCHLGNGCSITAVENGRSVDTSMGMTPLEGLVMGSRCGDIDPGILINLLRTEFNDESTDGTSTKDQLADQLDRLLNHHSGMQGMAGSNDMREIADRAEQGDEGCRQAIQVFTHRVRKYIGAYAAAMGGTDVILFTGGIGEHTAFIRHRIAQRFGFLGADLDEDRNRYAKLSEKNPVAEISSETSRIKILVVAANEELAIAESASTLVSLNFPVSLNSPVSIASAKKTTLVSKMPIPVAMSARHVHLDRATCDALFGEGYELTPEHPLSQPGQFAARETLTLVGARNRIERVRILGPLRAKPQVEISRSDEFFLGIDAPIRASGDTENTPGITMIGAAGSITTDNGVICALRHIHMHPDDAEKLAVNDGDLVSVAVSGEDRDLTFSDVQVRVNEQFRLEMHIDTDEANAAGLNPQSIGTLI